MAEEVDYSQADACSDLRAVHNACFFEWYRRDFLNGTAREIACEEEWRTYQACLDVREQQCVYGEESLREGL